MPTNRDYAIATLLGEDNLGTPQGQGAILDSIFNRQASPSSYGAKSSSLRDIVTAGNGSQYNTWMPSDAGNYSRASRALLGPGSLTPAEAAQYYQAAQVYDDYVANQGGYRGSAQGATFYQTPASADNSGSYQNKFYGSNGDNYITVGNHQFTGQNGLFYKDPAAYQSKFGPQLTAPLDPTSPFNAGLAANVSDGIANGSIGDIGRTVETGNPYAFASGTDASGGVANGKLGSNVTPYNAAPGAYDFSTQYLAANPDVAASGMNAFEHYANFGAKENRAIDTAGDRFDPNAYKSQNADVQANGFDPLTHYLEFGANEGRGATLVGPDGTTRTVSNLGITPTISSQITAQLQGAPGLSPTQAAGSALSPGAAEVNAIYQANLGRPAEAAVLQAYGNEANGSNALSQLAAKIYGSDEANAYRGRIAPEQAAQIQAQNATMFGAPSATSTIGAGNAVSSLPPGFNAQAYLQANPDVAASGIDAATHYTLFGGHEGRSLGPSGYTPTIGPGLSVQAMDGNGQPLSPGAAAVNQIYQQNLGRPAEASVLQAYANEANGSNTLSQLAASVYGSGEAANYRSHISPDLAALIQPQNAQMFGAPALTPTIGAPGLTPTIGAPEATPTIGAGPAVTAQDGGFGNTVSNFGFSGLDTSGFNANTIPAVSATPVAYGTPFGGSSIVGGLAGQVRSDGTTAGTKSLAQTNNEFNAVANFANAQSKAQTANLGLAAVAPISNNIGLSLAVAPSFSKIYGPGWL